VWNKLRWAAGHDRTKKDVVAVVHIGQDTLAKRVNEFADTQAGLSPRRNTSCLSMCLPLCTEKLIQYNL
jgi:hypothetical protein